MATLKVSDLSVGDWVEFHHIKGVYIARPSFDKAIAQVIGTHRGAEVSVLVDGKREFYAIPLSAIQPIPITPEILEKNGWQRNEEDEYMAYYGDPMSGIAHTKGTCHYRLEVPEVSVVCYFVHQLQHALRLAGVDKEINL